MIYAKLIQRYELIICIGVFYAVNENEVVQILKCLLNMGDEIVIGCNFEKEYSRRFYFHDYEKIFAQVGVRVAEKVAVPQPGHAMTHLVRVKKIV